MLSMILAAGNNQNVNPIIFMIAGVFLLFFLIIGLLFWTIFRPWLQCFMSGTPVSVFQLVGMKLRRSPVQKLCELKIMATQAGVDLQWAQLESAALAGVDVELIIRAMIKAQGHGLQIRWEDALAQAKKGQFDVYTDQQYEP
jgi:uncharacterized protein YqfA (UPF0365 family)